MSGQSNKHKQAVVTYFTATRAEYRLLWRTHHSLGLHFGYYDDQHQTHDEAVLNINDKLADLAKITSDDYVLDAGCGVGGSAIWLAANKSCRALGINLVPRQLDRARRFAAERQLENLVQFKIADFADTGFEKDTFTVVWGLESIVHAENKLTVLNEAFRVLKPGGRLVIAEYLLREGPLSAQEQTLLSLWLKGWAMPSVLTERQYRNMAGKAGFINFTVEDWTSDIIPSLRRVHRWTRLFKPLSPLLRGLHIVNDSQIDNRIATESQLKLLEADAWRYKALLFKKPKN
jgi:tocopherol O-methyltransferase